MKSIDIKKILKRTFLVFWNICAVAGFLLIAGILYYLFDNEGNCLDRGKIYDPVQKICRDDCLTWNEKIGCVPITEENRNKKSKGLL